MNSNRQKSTTDFLLVAAPKVLTGASALALNLVLLRYFGPPDYGIYSLCTAAILLSDAILGSSLDMAVLRLAPLQHRTDEPLCLAIQKVGLLLKAGLGISFCLGMAVCALTLGLLHQKNAGNLLVATCAAILSLLLLRSAQVHPQIARRFALFGLLEFLQLAVKFGGIGLLLLTGRGSPSLVLMFFTLGPLCGFALWLTTAGREFARASRLSRQLASEIWHYARWFLLTFGLGAALSRLDLFLLSRWSTLSEVGIFSAGQAIAWVPQLTGTYLAIVLTPRIMPLVREGGFCAFYRKFQPVLLSACAAAYLLSLAAMPLIGPWLLPPSFQRSMHVIAALLPGALAGLATFPLTMSFVMFIRPKFLFVTDCITFPILLGLFFYAIPRFGAVGAAWVTSAANLTRAAIAQFMAWEWAQEADVRSASNLALEVGNRL